MRRIIYVLAAVLLFFSGCVNQTQETTTMIQPTTTEAAASTAATTATTEAAASTTLPSSASVDISGFAFNPQTLTVAAGSTVTWTNNDAAPHIIAGDGVSSETLKQGSSFSHVFAAPGTYSYHCSIHPSMRGTIIVE